MIPKVAETRPTTVLTTVLFWQMGGEGRDVCCDQGSEVAPNLSGSVSLGSVVQHGYNTQAVAWLTEGLP